jgi:hypothetical protein
MSEHKQWLDNEYSLWIKALQESTVHNFKEHPGVRRMLGEPDAALWGRSIKEFIPEENHDKFYEIDRIGRKDDKILSGMAVRMIYYAMEVMKRNPSSICEIGGGVGQFYAILRALGYKGKYWIFDLPEVRRFQYQYEAEVEKVTGLSMKETFEPPFDMLVSLYALGEFDNETKQLYETIIDARPHGYIAFNPHSGASDSLSIFENHNIKVTPGIEPGISIIEW